MKDSLLMLLRRACHHGTTLQNPWFNNQASPVMCNLLRACRVLSGLRLVSGQPVHATHPEAIAARRQRLAQLMTPNSLAVLPANNTVYMSGVIPYPYRQDADFLYLTGITQKGIAFIHRSGSEERWNGATLDEVAAKADFGADHAFTTLELPRWLQKTLPRVERVLFDAVPSGGYLQQELGAMLAPTGSPRPYRLARLRPLLHRLRWTKSPAEVALMRRSAQIAAAALRHCMQQSHAGVGEWTLAADFEHKCKVAGAQRMSYPPVVAGGPDACTIHYSRNDKTVADGQLLLMDAGCEYYGYTSDVTRTWPVNGRFSSAQRDVYSAVLEAHQRCLQACLPGTTLRALHQLSVQVICEALIGLGVLTGVSLDAAMQGMYRPFYCHSVGHWLGLDTHDTANVPHDVPLKEGTVLTIEPGLYIPDNARYGSLRGIGVRLEDDVLVTAAQCEVLSSSVPVKIDDVEALVGSQRHCLSNA